MKKAIKVILVMSLFIFIIYKGFDFIKDNLDIDNPIDTSIDAINSASELAVKQSANNFITTLEYDLSIKLAYGEIDRLPDTYHDVNIKMNGTLPTSVNLDLVMGKVTSGTLEYEKFIVLIEEGKIKNLTKK